MSDLHIDVNSEITRTNVLDDICNWLKSKEYDVLVIAGDLTNDATRSIKHIDIIEEFTGKPIYFVAGNHDTWANKSSWESQNTLVNHHSSLICSPKQVGNHVIIGDMGWYDYSFGDSHIPKHVFKDKKKKYWTDAFYSVWNMEDETLLNLILDDIKSQLDHYKDKPVVFVNHFIPYKQFLTYKPHDSNWNFCNAYMGSEKIGELIDQYDNVEYVVFGHTHRRYGMVDFRDKKIICNPLGYYGEWSNDNVYDQFEEASIIIDL